MKNTLILSSVFALVLALSLFVSTNAFADHDATGASTETHTSTSATGGTSGGTGGSSSGSTETTSATSVSVTAVPVKMEVEVETEHGVQTTTVKPDSSSTCGGKEMPKLECPSGYAVGCNTAVSQWACVKSAAAADTRAGVPTGAGAAAGAATKTSGTDQDDDSDSIDTVLEDDDVRASVFIKIDGVKGESSDDKAPAFIKIDGVKGESSDDKKGSAEGSTDVAMGDKPTQSDFSIMIDSSLFRGWDPEKKEEVVGIAPKTAAAVSNEEELALFVAAQSSDDPQMESISLNYTKIEFKYRSDAKLFGLIPSSLLQDVSLEGGAVNLKKPWYAFLFTGAIDLEDIQAAVEETKKGDHKDEIEILSWSFGANNTGSMSAGSGGGSGKVNVASGDVNGDGMVRTAADVAAEFAALSGVMKTTYDLKAAKK